MKYQKKYDDMKSNEVIVDENYKIYKKNLTSNELLIKKKEDSMMMHNNHLFI